MFFFLGPKPIAHQISNSNPLLHIKPKRVDPTEKKNLAIFTKEEIFLYVYIYIITTYQIVNNEIIDV